MVRRPLRPTFSLDDQKRLVDSLRETHHLTIACSSAEQFGSPLYSECNAVAKSLSAFAEILTGKPGLFQTAGFVVRLPQTDQLDDLTTMVFNAMHDSPAFEPIESLDELEWEGPEKRGTGLANDSRGSRKNAAECAHAACGDSGEEGLDNVRSRALVRRLFRNQSSQNDLNRSGDNSV